MNTHIFLLKSFAKSSILDPEHCRSSKTLHKNTSYDHTIALFTVTFSHLHYNVFERGCEAISGNFVLTLPAIPVACLQISC